MSKFWILVNTVIILGMMSISLWFSANDMDCSIFLAASIGYLFWYSVYMIINRLFLFFKKQKFNDKLLLIPVLTAIVQYFCVSYLFSLYDTLHESRFSYINISENGIVSCRNSDNCRIRLQTIHGDEKTPVPALRFYSVFEIKSKATKTYTAYRRDDCLLIHDNAMSMFGHKHSEYEKCNLNPLTIQEALQSGFTLTSDQF
jgi:hypothetical protein